MRTLNRQLVVWLLLCGCSGTSADPETPSNGRASAVAVVSVAPSASDEPPLAVSGSASVSASAPPPAEPSLDLAEMRLGDALAPAAARAREGKWPEVVQGVDKAWPSIEKAGQLDDMCAAQALKGRALFAQGQDKKAAEPFAKVLSIYREKPLATLGDTADPIVLARARVVMEAVSEATFFTPARQQRELEKSKPPVYRGNGDRDEVRRFIEKDFAAWLKKRREAMDEVEKGYQNVLSIQPMPSPRWVVKASERVGALHQSLLVAIGSVPIPKAWTGGGDIAGLPKQEIREAYLAALQEVSAPWVARAKAAYTVCLNRATSFQITLPEVNNCKKWLQDHE